MTQSLSSPTLSVSSADEALFEILGIDRLILLGDADTEDDNDEFDMAAAAAKDNSTPSNNTMTQQHVLLLQQHTPPRHCHRPLTPHTPLLVETRSMLLSAAQCRYIIYNLGYRTTNNGGTTFGPTYITAAALQTSSSSSKKQQHETASAFTAAASDDFKVQLLNPNHHKVCVFYSDLVLTWLEQAFETAGIDEVIQSWCRTNHFATSNRRSNVTSTKEKDVPDYKDTTYHYRINPRLRLVRYDACDHDVFLPHYDATTTTTVGDSTTNGDDFIPNNNNKNNVMPYEQYESKLTILLYLNTGGGVHFQGGNTIFLNALQPSSSSLHSSSKNNGGGGGGDHNLEICPQLGKLVIFNHELYHASQALTIMTPHEATEAATIATTTRTKSQNGNSHGGGGFGGDVGGGTKFVLRSDVMFPVVEEQPNIAAERNSDASPRSDTVDNWFVSSSLPQPQPQPAAANNNDDNDDSATTTTTTTTPQQIRQQQPMTIQRVLDKLVLVARAEEDGHDDYDGDLKHEISRERLVTVLQQLDMEPSMPLTTITSLGPMVVETMMMDLGLEEAVAKTFYRHCQEELSSV